MSAAFENARRVTSRSEDLAVQGAAANYDQFMAYTGPFEVQGDRILHRVEVSALDAWTGTPPGALVQGRWRRADTAHGAAQHRMGRAHGLPGLGADLLRQKHRARSARASDRARLRHRSLPRSPTPAPRQDLAAARGLPRASGALRSAGLRALTSRRGLHGDPAARHDRG
ncbi:MAG: lipocalin-like domain-containing protein [Deltaproteobacteria bacterium]|nr:lipocalin-like domain-containing protein [Deltaproteobacteria bacterium]MBW2420055.1 lipocalin-like domain-containing protein [Deltaproteobacteria bacterium]